MFYCANLRLIILLSAIRKILAICLVNRVGDKIMHNTPTSQATYQHNRSTKQRVFAFKILAERAIATINNTSHILLMDMSKAFDAVNRETPVEVLRTIMDPDELHMTKILMKVFSYASERNWRERFTTNTGVPQWDCLNLVVFILYPSKAFSY